jgi:hypothetical protein
MAFKVHSIFPDLWRYIQLLQLVQLIFQFGVFKLSSCNFYSAQKFQISEFEILTREQLLHSIACHCSGQISNFDEGFQIQGRDQ